MIIDISLIVFLAFFILLLITVVVHMIFWVPYVPTPNAVVDRMVASANLKQDETVFDLGCGDGRLLIAAEKHTKVRPVGFEIAPMVYLLALIRKVLARSKSKLVYKSFFNADLSKADVIFCYLLPNVMPRLAEKIGKECKKGTRIISNTFHIHGMEPKRVLAKEPKLGIPTIYVYEI